MNAFQSIFTVIWHRMTDVFRPANERGYDPKGGFMKITDDHMLENAILEPVDGGSTMPTRRFLVIHFTAGASGMSSINYWRNSKKASAHIVIDRDGTIYQCRPFNMTAGHAGRSKWTDPMTGEHYNGLNSCSIGIELANGGHSYPAKFSHLQPLRAEHKHGGGVKDWETFTKPQLDACEAVSKALCQRYNLDDVLGHEDCSPGRKTDPGPAFPMDDLRRACGFTHPIGTRINQSPI